MAETAGRIERLDQLMVAAHEAGHVTVACALGLPLVWCRDMAHGDN